MVLDDIIVEKSCLPLTFVMVIVDRPMQFLAFRTIVPVLRSKRSEDGMFNREYEVTPICEAVIDFPTNRAEILYIVECKRTNHHIELSSRKIDVFDRESPILDMWIVGHASGAF